MARPRRPTVGHTARAGIPRRLAALVIDWFVAVAISAGFLGYDALATLGVFFVTTTVLVGTLGSTIGHRVVGLGVRGLDGGLPGLGRAAIRTVALCLVIPAVVWTSDRRGVHDLWAGTQVLQLR